MLNINKAGSTIELGNMSGIHRTTSVNQLTDPRFRSDKHQTSIRSQDIHRHRSILESRFPVGKSFARFPGSRGCLDGFSEGDMVPQPDSQAV
jgi:hypothetical protein